MKVLIILALALSFAIVLSSDSLGVKRNDFSSKEYLKLSGDEKMDRLWDKITEDTTSLPFYGKMEIAKMLMPWYDLKPTFQNTADVFPEGRLKVIHTTGSIAKARFVPIENNPYTGDLSGSENLLIRLSVAKEMDKSKSTAEEAFGNFAPGISLKFLRSGRPSGNLVAMFGIQGQHSWNFFKNDFTNSFDMPRQGSTAEKVLSAKFSSVTYWTVSMGLSDLATYDQNGDEAETPIYPFRLIFKPNPNLRDGFSDDFEEDFTEQLKKIEPGTVLYAVYAVENPGCDPKHIGDIKITSELTTSRFADEKLFFQHNTVDDEDKIHGWSKYRDSYSIFSGATFAKTAKKGDFKCPFSKFFN